MVRMTMINITMMIISIIITNVIVVIIYRHFLGLGPTHITLNPKDPIIALPCQLLTYWLAPWPWWDLTDITLVCEDANLKYGTQGCPRQKSLHAKSTNQTSCWSLVQILKIKLCHDYVSKGWFG